MGKLCGNCVGLCFIYWTIISLCDLDCGFLVEEFYDECEVRDGSRSWTFVCVFFRLKNIFCLFRFSKICVFGSLLKLCMDSFPMVFSSVWNIALWKYLPE